MESKPSLTALVKSPSKDGHIRESHGFSLKEIKEAGKSIDLLKNSNIKIDYFRKSLHTENVKRLKSLEFPSKEKKKKKPFIKKEKKRAPFKSKEEKIKKKPDKTIAKSVPKLEKKVKVKPAKKEKVKITKVEKVEKLPSPATGKLLTELSGLGDATAKKFIELGVTDIEALCKEQPEELAPLIKGVSVDRLKKWIEEGKGLI